MASNYCNDLRARIAAETDPQRRAALQAQYDRECGTGTSSGGGPGGGTPPPK